MIRALLVSIGVVVCFCVPSPAFAQYTPAEIADRGFQAQVLATGQALTRNEPTAWSNAHNAGEPQGSEFVRRWALALRDMGILACVNGKRGSDTLSQDVLTFPLTEGGATDTSGRYRGRIAIIDVIIGAGEDNASLGWIDQSVHAPGKCIDPRLEWGEVPGNSGVGGTGGGSPPPPRTDTGGSTPAVDLAPVLAALAGISERLQALEGRQPPTVDLHAVNEYIDAMVGAGPGVGAPNHVTDIKERLDVIRGQLEQLNAWLRSRSVFRF
jgi:hypothetical protein